MTTLDKLIEQIRANTGIRRERRAVNYDKAHKCFIAIANSMLEWRGVKYDPTSVEGAIKALISWAYFLDDSLDYHKGILLKGGTGRGKSFLLKIFSEFLKVDSMQYVSNGKTLPLLLTTVNARNIAMFYQKEGLDGIQHFTQTPCLNIDDIGAEMDETSHFGNKTSVIDWILNQREENNLITFGTTNFNRLSEKYDDRIISRINSLFNVIPVIHDMDFRVSKQCHHDFTTRT